MQTIVMKRARGEEDAVVWQRQHTLLFILLGIVLACGLYALVGIVTARSEDQLTLVGNTTQYLEDGGNWTDVFFENTLTTSAYWSHATLVQPQSAQVTSTASDELTYNVYLGLHPSPSEAPCPPSVTIQTRVVRQRGSDPLFYQVGSAHAPSGNSVLLTALQLQPLAGDVYKFQWSADCASMQLTPTDIDLGLLGVALQGIRPVSAYLVVTVAP